MILGHLPSELPFHVFEAPEPQNWLATGACTDHGWFDELFIAALLSHMVGQSDDSKIDTCVAGSHPGSCFIDLQARLSAHVWVFTPSALGHEMVVNFVFSDIS